MEKILNFAGATWLLSILVVTLFALAQFSADGLAVVPKWLIVTSLLSIVLSAIFGDLNDKILLQFCVTPAFAAVGAMSIGLQKVVGTVGENTLETLLVEAVGIVVSILFIPPFLGLIYALTEGRKRKSESETAVGE